VQIEEGIEIKRIEVEEEEKEEEEEEDVSQEGKKEEKKEGEEAEVESEKSIEFETNRDQDCEIFVVPCFIKPGRHNYFVHTSEGLYFH
jgi:hypothetical protein